MSRGAGRIAVHRGGRGMFAAVSVEVTLTESGLAIEASPDALASRGAYYLPAVTVGVRYAWERLRNGTFGTGAVVTILEVEFMPTDSTEMEVVAAATLALWDAVGFEPERPLVLDSERRHITFPV